AGSGITPILSIMKAVLETEPKSTFTLFYGNRTADGVIFKEAIEALKNRYMNRLSVHYLLSREYPGSDLFYGRITAEKCGVFVKPCSPGKLPMSFSLRPGRNGGSGARYLVRIGRGAR
ncbi:MAG: hypothetical protein IPO07_27230, partial [Haliscomenobacter sp.]|nr:hypothetical protein [Haliscomenobacter sp.]